MSNRLSKATLSIIMALVLMLLTSLKEITSQSGLNLFSISEFSFKNYIDMFSRGGITKFVFNSALVAAPWWP